MEKQNTKVKDFSKAEKSYFHFELEKVLSNFYQYNLAQEIKVDTLYSLSGEEKQNMFLKIQSILLKPEVMPGNNGKHYLINKYRSESDPTLEAQRNSIIRATLDWERLDQNSKLEIENKNAILRNQ